MTKKLELTSQIEQDIIRLLMNGMPLTQIASKEGSPSLSKIYNWIQENKEFADKIVTARRIACQTYLDKMITELETTSNKDVGILREKLIHYRWMASKLIPIYGDKQEVKVDQRIEISWNANDKLEENVIKDVTNSQVAEAQQT